MLLLVLSSPKSIPLGATPETLLCRMRDCRVRTQCPVVPVEPDRRLVLSLRLQPNQSRSRRSKTESTLTLSWLRKQSPRRPQRTEPNQQQSVVCAPACQIGLHPKVSSALSLHGGQPRGAESTPPRRPNPLPAKSENCRTNSTG